MKCPARSAAFLFCFFFFCFFLNRDHSIIIAGGGKPAVAFVAKFEKKN